VFNFGVRGHDITGVSDPDQLGLRLERLGIKNVQLALNKSFPDLLSGEHEINPGMGNYISRTLLKYSVRIAILGCYINMIHPKLAKREEALRRFEAYVRNAKYFDCSIVASETGSCDTNFNYTEKNFSEEKFLESEESIRRLVKVGEKENVVVAIEPNVMNPIHDVETAIRVFNDISSPNLGIIVDPMSLVTADLVPQQLQIVTDMFKSLGDHVVALHLKDFIIENGNVVPTTFGKGLLPAEDILKIYASYRPMGYVISEETRDSNLMKPICMCQ
jgi:sugar phosphate isomerase/epimerase